MVAFHSTFMPVLYQLRETEPTYAMEIKHTVLRRSRYTCDGSVFMLTSRLLQSNGSLLISVCGMFFPPIAATMNSISVPCHSVSKMFVNCINYGCSQLSHTCSSCIGWRFFSPRGGGGGGVEIQTTKYL